MDSLFVVHTSEKLFVLQFVCGVIVLFTSSKEDNAMTSLFYSLEQSKQKIKMVRAIPRSFHLAFKVQFRTNIRGHHVYKDSWTPLIGEVNYLELDVEEFSDKKKIEFK